MIFLIYGATSAVGLTQIEMNDVREQGSEFVIKVPETKANGIRSFTVKNEYAEYVKKYKQLRPANVAHDRFFVNYQKGKCTVQPIGRNKFLHAPKLIAKFLKLDDADNYTCHSFRKESLQVKRKTCGPSSEQINFETSADTTPNSVDPSTVTIASIAPTTENIIGGKRIAFDLLPKKSQEKYSISYDKFMAWKSDEQIDKDCFSEEVMLRYFDQLKSELPSFFITIFYSDNAMCCSQIQTNVTFGGIFNVTNNNSKERQCRHK